MEQYKQYFSPIPAFLRRLAETPPMERLKGIGMNCGCEYTAFPRFQGLQVYSRFDHSLGVALLVWRFTGSEAQAAAGLLHDVATPVFAHVVDFLRGDHLTQEATEDGTREMIDASPALQAALHAQGLSTQDVCDYHRYPIADNDSPRLSADRLEYTLGNSVNYGFWTSRDAAACCNDLAVTENEEGQPELAFRTAEMGERFARVALRCAEIYVAGDDRLAMQLLAELLGRNIRTGVLTPDDLYTTEAQVIAKLCADPDGARQWADFRRLHRVVSRSAPGSTGIWRRVPAKKRFIDPLVQGRGRVSTLCAAFRLQKEEFLARPQTDWLGGE